MRKDLETHALQGLTQYANANYCTFDYRSETRTSTLSRATGGNERSFIVVNSGCGHKATCHTFVLSEVAFAGLTLSRKQGFDQKVVKMRVDQVRYAGRHGGKATHNLQDSYD